MYGRDWCTPSDEEEGRDRAHCYADSSPNARTPSLPKYVAQATAVAPASRIRLTAAGEVTPPTPMIDIARNDGCSDLESSFANECTFPKAKACIDSPPSPPLKVGNAKGPLRKCSPSPSAYLDDSPSCSWSLNKTLEPNVFVQVRNATGFRSSTSLSRQYLANVCTISEYCPEWTYGGSFNPIVNVWSRQKCSARTSTRGKSLDCVYAGGGALSMLGQLVLISTAIRACADSWSLIRNRNCWISEIISDSSEGLDDVMLIKKGFEGLDGGVGLLRSSSIHIIY